MADAASETPRNSIPKEVLDYHEKGLEAVKRENYGYAIELFSSALALKQDFAEARYYLWLALWENQKKSSDPLKLKLIFAKISSIFAVLRGFSLQKSGKTWEAIYQLEKAMKIDPGNIGTINTMAECFLREGQTFNAIKILEAIPQINNKDYKTLKKIAQLYKSINDYRKARAYYNATLGVNPNDIDAERGLKDLDALKTLEGHFENQ